MKNDLLSALTDSLPKYEVTLPVSGKLIVFSPFKVKDAKNLSIIFQENNKKLALKALYEILKSNSDIDNLDSVCLADAEYLFLHIRAKSIDEVISVIFQDQKYQLNISDIKCINGISKKIIDIGPELKIELGSPLLNDFTNLQNFDDDVIKKTCIKKIILKNEIFDLKKFVPEELKTFINNLPITVMKSIDEFMLSQPRLTASIKLDDGSDKEVGGSLDFFILR